MAPHKKKGLLAKGKKLGEENLTPVGKKKGAREKKGGKKTLSPKKRFGTAEKTKKKNA